MSQIFGEFIERFPAPEDALELSLSSSSKPIKTRWLNNRLSAYFLADYFLNILGIDAEDSEAEERSTEIKTSISYISNELLENAIKFNEDNINYPVRFGIHFVEKANETLAVIFVKNTINPQKAQQFQTFIKELLSADLNELYVQQIEKTAEDEDSEASGLGLLTAINDYSAKLGWKFEPDPSNSQIITVTTMAQIVV